MGIAERKERERAERKALIIRCAKALILEQGAEVVSMGEIAKRAELSKATLYLYFSSRDILFREICIETGFHFVKHFRSLHNLQMSALDSLKLFWKCYVDIFGKSDDMKVLFNMKEYIVPNYPFISVNDDKYGVIAPSFELFNMIRDMIKAGIDEGDFERDVNPILIAHTLISLFSLIVDNAVKFLKKPQEVDVVLFDEMQNIFQIILRGIAREGIDRSRLVLGDKRETVKPSGYSG
ncbi:MAG: TetR/AcrR family transcriptional regulator; helix-turn-helix transcriptional regulator [Treponema sp.]|nr:TetR/AcrR family transcriptional regulator; helix-turn-helix transcriptional regulator [Treponema sp.]